MKSFGTAGPVSYRRRAILNRIHGALDAFYLLQKIDWEYDVRTTLDKILSLALEELEFEGGKRIERALIIIEKTTGGALEVEAGFRTGDPVRLFSRTVVHETIRIGEPILCENAKDDPRFMEAESIKVLQILSLISVPLTMEGEKIGALYIESESPKNIFTPQDLEFLGEFAATIAPYLKAALIHQNHVQEIQKLRAEVGERYGLENMVGRSAAIRGVFELVKLSSKGDRTVLITGESGSGKELVARAIHHNSHRAKGPMVVVDCSGLSEHILESELFGHKKGAFTGATTDKIGAFEDANGGTIFLDEISDAPRPLQQKLRRVLQEGEIRPVGDTQFRKVDVRIICATNHSLPKLVEEGKFIRDLYFRINKFPIHIPPLRERREDIPPLVHYFIDQCQDQATGRPRVNEISTEALELLVSLDWRANNIRELRNVVELAVDLSRSPIIDLKTVQRVLRIQRGESLETEEIVGGSGKTEEKSIRSLLRIERESFQSLLRTSSLKKEATGDGGDESREGPFYKLYQEFAARTIIEGLRATDWKIRPAARLLGISPMKLRGELKSFLSASLACAEGDIGLVAEELEIPVHVLSRKAADFGIEGSLKNGPASQGSEEGGNAAGNGQAR